MNYCSRALIFTFLVQSMPNLVPEGYFYQLNLECQLMFCSYFYCKPNQLLLI